MTNHETEEQIKEELIILYTRYFGPLMAKNYREYYRNKDIKTVILSAEGILAEYAGETKGKQLLYDLCSKYNFKPKL